MKKGRTAWNPHRMSALRKIGTDMARACDQIGREYRALAELRGLIDQEVEDHAAVSVSLIGLRADEQRLEARVNELHGAIHAKEAEYLKAKIQLESVEREALRARAGAQKEREDATRGAKEELAVLEAEIGRQQSILRRIHETHNLITWRRMP